MMIRDTAILKGLLEEQVRLHSQLLDQLEGQRSHIARLQIAGLEKTGANELRLAKEIEELEEIRAEEMAHWARTLGVCLETLSLRELIRHLSEAGGHNESAAELWALGEELNDLIDEIRRANEANRTMLKRGLEFFDEKFQAATREATAGSYTRGGVKKGASRIPRMVNVRA